MLGSLSGGDLQGVSLHELEDLNHYSLPIQRGSYEAGPAF